MEDRDPSEKKSEQPSNSVDAADDRDDGDLSIERLSAAFAEMLDEGARETSGQKDPPRDHDSEDSDESADKSQSQGVGQDAVETLASDSCRVTPTSILEAMLFVGDPRNQPLATDRICELLRGVQPAEVESLVGELNARYDRDGCPYFIQSEGAGYRLVLRPQYDELRDRYFGRSREVRLSQAAIETLALVAYNEPVSREKLNELRGTSTRGVLSQLVRRQLLRVERNEEQSGETLYYTTDRFLSLFGLESLADLPQGQNLGPS